MKSHVTLAKAALRTWLLAELEAKLAEADADETVGVPTPPPAVIYLSDRMATEQYPAIELIATSSAPQANSALDLMQHRIVVGVSVLADDEENATAQVERYLWAIRRLCKDALLAPDAFAGPIDVGVESYTPVGELDQVERPFVKGGSIELFVVTAE